MNDLTLMQKQESICNLFNNVILIFLIEFLPKMRIKYQMKKIKNK